MSDLEGCKEDGLANDDGGGAFAGGFGVVLATFGTGFVVDGVGTLGAGTTTGTGLASIVVCLLGTGFSSGSTVSGSEGSSINGID